MDRIAGLVANVAEKGRGLVPMNSPARRGSSAGSVGVAKPKRAQAALHITEFEEQYARLNISKCRTPPILLTFPEDEVLVRPIKRTLRTEVSSVPPEVTKVVSSLPPHVRDCLYAFEKDWLVLDWGHRKYCAPPDITPIDVDTLPELRFEAQEFDWPEEVVNQVNMDQDIISLPSKQATLEDIIQLEPRHNIFSLYDFPKEQIYATETRPKGQPYARTADVQVLINMKELRLQIGEVDPFFLTAALYQLNRDSSRGRRRLSEFFHFELNIHSTLSLVKGRPGPPSRLTSARSAMFTIPKCEEDIYVVIRIEKVLQGPYEHGVEPYFKVNMKQKQKNKFINAVEECAKRLGRYTQPFGLAVLPLFAHGTKLTHKPQEIFISELLRVRDLSDAYIFNKSSQLTGPPSQLKKSFKIFPGHLAIDARLVDPDEPVPNRFTTSYIPVLPQNKNAPVVREIQPFGTSENDASCPFSDYINHLYVYPINVYVGGYKGPSSARNVTCQVYLIEGDERPQTPNSIDLQPLKVMYGRGGMSDFCEDDVCAVSYHQTKPLFFEEMKILLPNSLTPRHHLLFIFKHIQCKPVKARKKRDVPAQEDVLAFAFLPLMNGGRFIKNGEHELSLAYELPAGYLNDEIQETEIRWMDRRRPVFSLRTQLQSSVFSEVEQLNHYFHTYDNKGCDDTILISALNAMHDMDSSVTGNYFPVLANQMLELVCTASDAVAGAAFRALICFVDKIQQLDKTVDRHPYLVSYINYFYENFGGVEKKPFEEIVKTWSLLLFQRKDATEIENSSRYSWFFFDLIVKSIAQLLGDSGKLKHSVKRGTRVTPDFVQALAGLVSLLIRELHQLLPAPTPVGQLLNTSIALFVKDLFAIIDRGAVLGFVQLYCEEIDCGVIGSLFSVAKIEFLKIVTDYEHYVQLNLPIEPRFNSSVIKLMECMESLQFFSCLIIREISCIMKETISEKRSLARSAALAMLRNLLVRHEHDPRYKDDPVMQQKIALLYFPYVLMLIQFEANGSLITHADNSWQESDMEDLLIVFLWVVKTVRRRFLRKWWRADTPGRVFFFFVVLAKALEVFRFRTAGETKQQSVVLAPRQPTSAVISKMVDPIKQAAMKQGSKNSFGTLARRRRKLKQSQKQGHDYGEPAGASPRIMGADPEEFAMPKSPRSMGRQTPTVKRRAYLSLEVNSVVLELLLHFMTDFKSELGRREDKHMDRVVCNFLLLLLKQNQSEEFLSHLFQTVRFLVYNFPKQLFLYNTPYVGDLTYEVLRHCNFCSAKTRGEAIGILYIFFKTNWLIKKNMARMKLQCSVAVAKLVGEGGIADVRRLQAALNAVVDQAKKDRNPPEFVKQLEQLLIVRLSTVLRNTKLIEDYEYDSEMVADLIYEISLGYRDSPDIRYTWLDSLSKRHGVDKNHEESAQCRIHTTALIVAHLQLLKRDDAVQVSRASLRAAAPNCSTEFDTSSTSASEEGVCSSVAFTRRGLFTELSNAVSSLKEEQIFESAIILQRIVSLIHKKERKYAELVNTYNDLAGLCHMIVQSDELHGRIFANYYRVVFYGKEFGRVDGVEFIYKEQGYVRLADISNRLKQRYNSKFGEDRVVMLPGTSAVEPSKLDPEKLHIQVCSVEPFFTDEQRRERKTPFQLNTNLKRFIFETPLFVSEEGCETERTGKVKTILRVEHPFPFVLKRIRIVSKKEIVLSPIQSALEAIRERTRVMLQEIEAKQPNSKTLQMVLQGSVLLQVNAGPLEFCRVFLGPEGVTKYKAAEVKSLKAAMGEFVATCVRALKVNKSLIDANQIAFHDQLVKGYVHLKTEVQKYIGVGQQNLSASDLLKKAGSTNKLEGMRQIAQTATNLRTASAGQEDKSLLSTTSAAMSPSPLPIRRGSTTPGTHRRKSGGD